MSGLFLVSRLPSQVGSPGEGTAYSGFRRPVTEGMPHLQRKDGRQARSVSGLEPVRFGAQKLAVLPAGLLMLSLDVSRQSHC